MRAASVRPNTSGCSVSSSADHLQFDPRVANTSRAMWAVVTASFTEWHPAVLGSTCTPRSRIRAQNPWPARSPLDLAPQRDGDDFRARRAHRLGQHRRGGIARAAEEQPRTQRPG